MHLETTDDGQQLTEQINCYIIEGDTLFLFSLFTKPLALQMDPEESHILLIGESVNDPNVFSFVSQEIVVKSFNNFEAV